MEGPPLFCISRTICNAKRSWCDDGRSTAVPLEAPDSAKDFEEHKKFMQVLKRVVLEGRKEGARRYIVACDLNVNLGLTCMEDSDDLKDIYGPRCLHDVGADLGGLRKGDVAGYHDRVQLQSLFYLVEVERLEREIFYTHSLGKDRANIAVGHHIISSASPQE